MIENISLYGLFYMGQTKIAPGILIDRRFDNTLIKPLNKGGIFSMTEIAWKLFENSGSISYYLFYKALDCECYLDEEKAMEEMYEGYTDTGNNAPVYEL